MFNKKDFEVSKEIFGDVTKKQCQIIKKLSEKGERIIHCETYSIVRLKNVDDCGYLIPNYLFS